MSDLISRQAAIDGLKKISFSHWFECGEYLSEDTREIKIINSNKALETIEALPSAQPKTGKWIPHREKSREYIGTVLVNVEYDYWFCDACGYRVKNGQPMYNFCPNCGADMRGEANEVN